MIGSGARVRANIPLTVVAEPAVAPLEAYHEVYMGQTPQSADIAVRHAPVAMPFLTGTDASTYAVRKNEARFNRNAPFDARAILDVPDFRATLTPAPLGKFNGLSDSIGTCPYFGGCQPPDMALAASPAYVVQVVNTSIAIYSTNGKMQSGFPKNLTNFYGIPAPTPAGCDSRGPFEGDPRAFYDPTDGRFWVVAWQSEGTQGLNSCALKSLYWVAVSKSSNPTAGWNVYAFDMKSGTTNWADYTQIGLDATAFYFGGNMFNQAGTAYQYDEIFSANKKSMEAGLRVTPRGLKNISVAGVLVDTLQPVAVEGASPGAGLFINSFNINSGGGQCSVGCSGINVFAMANPLTAPKLTMKTITSLNYTLPPFANQPGKPSSVESLDTRITGTPVYRNGIISWAHETGVNTGGAVVPGIHWGQVAPTVVSGTITQLGMVQEGLLSFVGGRAATFGAVMTNSAGNLLMVFDSMGPNLDPSIFYVSRKISDPLGTFGAPQTLVQSKTPTIDNRWGDYEATSYDGINDNVWFASEFSGPKGDWSTFIGKTKL